VRSGRVGRSGGTGRWVLRAVLALILLVVFVLGATVFRVWHAGRTDERPRSDAIVVLGSAQYNGRPSAILAARLDHAARLYRAGVATRIVTVGGRAKGDRYSEAGAGQLYLAKYGIPSDAVLPIEQGTDTLNSLTAAAEVFNSRGWHSAVLVTDPWHSLRARQMFRDVGIRTRTSPTHSGPSVQDRSTEARYIVRETAAYLFYRFFGDATPPANRPGAV
jgi:uncharacterized SAM-binding protein YcdF (DUF218 family)